MPNVAYYDATLADFLEECHKAIIGQLALRLNFPLEAPQKAAWVQEIHILKDSIPVNQAGSIFLEFMIPRMGKRADVVLVVEGIVFVLEFKVGAQSFERHDIEQVHDYALDLKNFHKGSHDRAIAPVLVATNAPTQGTGMRMWAADDVAAPIFAGSDDIWNIVKDILDERREPKIEAKSWAKSGYQPTPTIVEAAQALYQKHDVREITRSGAGDLNLGATTRCIEEIIEHSKATKRKSICFITGVPGAGKTLAGLNIATRRADEHVDEHAVFLSGNGPLVNVLREALARDEKERNKTPIGEARRRVKSFIQNIHHFREEALGNDKPPHEKVVIFDEAQRAWNQEKASDFMRKRKNYINFDMSEPKFLIGVMDRHNDWCVIICLVGGGQEINVGEAGLSEWLVALDAHFPKWDVYASDNLEGVDYVWNEEAEKILSGGTIKRKERLHLDVSMRSFRAEKLSEFVGHVVENRPDEANRVHKKIAARYPIRLTRNINEARDWLRDKARGSERYGLLSSSGAYRLRPDGIHAKAKIDPIMWFLEDRDDVRSSYALEEAATEFDVQGLELDWTGVCWDADFRYGDGQWEFHGFKGSRWQNVKAVERQIYLKNAYRVILTRARQGMVIFVPQGDSSDPTRLPEYYDHTVSYLEACGIPLGD